MKKTIFLMALFILAIGGQKICAQAEEASCSIEAWVTDRDPNGLNVRSKPGTAGKVLTTLKAGDGNDAIIVNIVGYSNGWVKISGAKKVSGDEVFSDIGWVSAKMIATGTKKWEDAGETIQLFTAANTSSKKNGTLPTGSTVKIAGFSCGWLKVELGGKTGWLRTFNICGNPDSKCS